MIYMIVVASHHFVDRHVAAQQDASSYVVGADSRDAQTVMAISGNLVSAGADRLDPVDLHQPSDTALADSEACLFEFHRHARTAIAAKAQAVLFPDMGQHGSVRANAPPDMS